jgi:hypothetical protein
MSTLVQDDENVLQHVQLYKSYASDNVYPFGADREGCPIVSWVKHLTRTCHPFLRGLSFLLVACISPSVCVTESGIPDSEIDRKIMKYAERCNLATPYLY